LRYVFFLLLGGCSGLYSPEPIDGMRIVEIVHSDSDTLSNACSQGPYGQSIEACAILAGMTCTLHLPERYSPFLYEHELSHCYGREDAPSIAMWKS